MAQITRYPLVSHVRGQASSQSFAPARVGAYGLSQPLEIVSGYSSRLRLYSNVLVDFTTIERPDSANVKVGKPQARVVDVEAIIHYRRLVVWSQHYIAVWTLWGL